MTKRIPVAAAKRFGQKYHKDQVIILCFDKETGETWTTTWGKTIKDCKEAAEGGNKINKLLEA